jgi:hypothetical protein
MKKIVESHPPLPVANRPIPMATALLLLLWAAPAAAPDTVVVCPTEFREALQPWVEYRVHQGHSLAMLSDTENPEEIRRGIRNAAKLGRLRFVVLVGDALPPDASAAVKARCVPVHYAKAKINILWGSEPYIATDNWYADLNDDQVPDVAIGRLAAASPEELRQVVAKTLAYEQSSDFGPWRRRLNFVAGMGGFGVLADSVLESAAQYFLTQNIPSAYRVAMTYGSWRSPYCPDPRLFHATTLGQLNEGSWFWVYIGHGNCLSLDRLHAPDRDYHIFDISDVSKLRCEHVAPIALFLTCYTGAIDSQPRCLAEEMLQQPGGPVAIIAGSRVTMPYAISVLSIGLLGEVFQKRCATVGEALLGAKQRMMQPPAEEDQQRAMIDTIASAISPAPKQLADERAEHVLLFNLFGDPLLRLHLPQPVELEVSPTATAGKLLRITGRSPIQGRATVELTARRGRLTFKPPARREYPQRSEDLADFQTVYSKANDPRLSSATMPLGPGRFETQLAVPPDAVGECQVCVFVEGADDCAVAAAAVKIEGVVAGRLQVEGGVR